MSKGQLVHTIYSVVYLVCLPLNQCFRINGYGIYTWKKQGLLLVKRPRRRRGGLENSIAPELMVEPKEFTQSKSKVYK